MLYLEDYLESMFLVFNVDKYIPLNHSRFKTIIAKFVRTSSVVVNQGFLTCCYACLALVIFCTEP